MEICLTKKYFGEVAAGAKEEKQLDLALNYINQNNEHIRNKIEKLKRKGKYNDVDAAMEEMMLPSTNGQIIKCNYYLRVSADHQGFTLGSRI